jgi:hypothetical protein
MGPRDFLDTIARPNVVDARAAPADQRRAFNAMAAITSLASHLFIWLDQNGHSVPKDDEIYKSQLAARSVIFGLAHDIATAQKHVFLTRPSAANRQVTTEAQVTLTQEGWDMSVFDATLFDVDAQVSVLTTSGTKRSTSPKVPWPFWKQR